MKPLWNSKKIDSRPKRKRRRKKRKTGINNSLRSFAGSNMLLRGKYFMPSFFQTIFA